MNKPITEIYPCVEYARVSTANEGQKESCANQIRLCDDYAKKHPELRVVERYVDDALTGGNDNRPEYQRLLSRIRQKDIRYILAKSTNRLCRSTEVDGQLQRICRENDVMIIFVDGGQIFNPFDGDAVTMHSIQMIFDQQYIYNQSKNGKIAHKQKCDKKILNANDVRYGYEWDYKNHCMVINEEQAVVVRKMFEWYVFGGLGVTEIARKLAEQGIYGERSGKILTANTVSRRLADSSYKGTFYLNTRGSKLNIGVGAKKTRFKRPKEEWVAVPGPAIISEELYDLAQRIREERCHVYDKPSKEASQARFRGTHLFSTKVFCGDCGSQYHFAYANRAKTIGEYRDFFPKKIKPLDAVCNNKKYNKIRENTLKGLCLYSINEFLKNHEECIDNIVKIIRDASREMMNDDTQIKIYHKKLQKIDKEIQKNLEAWRDAPDPDMKDDFLKMYQANKAEKTAIEQEIANLEHQQVSVEEFEKEIQRIRDKVEGMKQIQDIDRTVVENFIDRVIINKDGRINVILKFDTAFEALFKTKVISYLDSNGKVPVLKDIEIEEIKYIKDVRELEELNASMSVSCSYKAQRFHVHRAFEQSGGYAAPHRNHDDDGD